MSQDIMSQDIMSQDIMSQYIIKGERMGEPFDFNCYQISDWMKKVEFLKIGGSSTLEIKEGGR